MGETVAGGRLDPRGTLRVTTSFRLGRKHIAPILSLLAKRYPALDITLDAVDRRVDLVSENIDLDVRVGEVDEPHLVAHRIASSQRVPYWPAPAGCWPPLACSGRFDSKALDDVAVKASLLTHSLSERLRRHRYQVGAKCRQP